MSVEVIEQNKVWFSFDIVKFDVVETKLLVESAVRDWRAASLLEDSNTQRNILNLLSARMKE